MPATYAATSGSGSAAGIWTAIVVIDAVDVSAKVVGPIRVSADEGAARIAELALRPAGGTVFTIPAWVGKSITIDIADFSTGSPTSVSRLFAGLIDTPSLDLELATISLLCSDNLQNIVDGMSAGSIDTMTTDGYSSPVIFDPAARGWSRLQDRLSTIPAAVELDTAGALRLTSWAPSGVPDLSFTDSHLLDGSISVSLSSRNQLVNHVDIDFGYRIPRVKAEGWPVTYSYVNEGTIASHAAALNWWLVRSTVVDAIKAAGGTIESITYTPLPNYAIGGWTPNPDADYLLCMGFDAVVSFDYAQMIDEAHAITVSAPNSIAVVGTLRDRLSGALEGVYPPVPTAEQSMLLYANSISGIPPMDSATPSSGNTTAADVTLTADTDRAAANAAMRALIAIAKVRIWGSHRRNAVSARVPLNPAIDLDKTIDLTLTGLHAVGKCRSVTHTMDPDTAEAVTEFAIAICSVAGVGVSHADTPTTAPAGSSPATTALSGSASVDFNYLAAEDHKLTITFPGVEAVERNKATVALASSYDATLTEDILTITL